MGFLPSWTAQDIVELCKKGLTIEAQEKIMELRELALELRDENITLKENIKKLEKKGEIEKNLYFNGTYYILKNGKETKGTYCPKCWDDEKKLIRLQGNKNDMWQCPKCKSFYYGNNYRSPQPRKGSATFF